MYVFVCMRVCMCKDVYSVYFHLSVFNIVCVIAAPLITTLLQVVASIVWIMHTLMFRNKQVTRCLYICVCVVLICRYTHTLTTDGASFKQPLKLPLLLKVVYTGGGKA